MKKIFAFVLSVILAFTLFPTLLSCHGSRSLDAFVVPEEFDTSKNYEITFWAKNDTNRTQVKIYEKAISDFHELYPNINVTLRLYTDYGRIYNDVITNIPTNTTPNVCITYPDHIATYKTGKNVVVPLDELYLNEAYGLGGTELKFDSPRQDEVISKFLNECKIDDSLYALPFMRSTEVCYVNKTYVEKLGYELPDGLTWDFIWEVSKAATKKDSDGNFELNGQKVLIPFIYKSTDNMMIQMLKQKHAEYSSDEGEILIFNDTTKEILNSVAELVEEDAFSTFKISGYPANFLNAGQCIFAIDSTAGATWMGTDAPLCDISEDKIIEFETEVMLLPQFDTDEPQMISQGPSVCIFNKTDSQEVLASWLFAEYLLSNDVQIAYSKTEGYAPVTTKAQSSQEYANYLSRTGEDNDEHYRIKIKATQLLLDNVDSTFVTPVYNGSTSLRNAAGQLIEQVVKSIKRGETVDDEYIDNAFDEVLSLYRLDQISSLNEKSLDRKDGTMSLPTVSIIFLSVIAALWVLIGVYYLLSLKKNRKGNRS